MFEGARRDSDHCGPRHRADQWPWSRKVNGRQLRRRNEDEQRRKRRLRRWRQFQIVGQKLLEGLGQQSRSSHHIFLSIYFYLLSLITLGVCFPVSVTAFHLYALLQSPSCNRHLVIGIFQSPS